MFSLLLSLTPWSSVHAEPTALCRPQNVSRVQRVIQKIVHDSVPRCKTPPKQIVNFNLGESLNNSVLLDSPTYKDSEGYYHMMGKDGYTLVYKRVQRRK